MHMVSFEEFVKSMLPSLLELKVIPSFCFPFKTPDDLTATNNNIEGLHLGIGEVLYSTVQIFL